MLGRIAPSRRGAPSAGPAPSRRGAPSAGPAPSRAPHRRTPPPPRRRPRPGAPPRRRPRPGAPPRRPLVDMVLVDLGSRYSSSNVKSPGNVATSSYILISVSCRLPRRLPRRLASSRRISYASMSAHSLLKKYPGLVLYFLASCCLMRSSWLWAAFHLRSFRLRFSLSRLRFACHLRTRSRMLMAPVAAGVRPALPGCGGSCTARRGRGIPAVGRCRGTAGIAARCI